LTRQTFKIMKKTIGLLSILAFTLIVCAYGQKPVIELTFSAAGSGQYIPLDSIYVENLSQIGDTMLYAPDTVLLLNYSTGIREQKAIIEKGLFISQNFPNPFRGQTSIDLYLPEGGKISLIIRTLMGDVVGSYQNSLTHGWHSFAFIVEHEGNYMLSATCNDITRSIKMVGLKASKPVNSQIIYEGRIDNLAPDVLLKTSKSINNFEFSLGHKLRFIGYAKTSGVIIGSDVIEDSVKINKTYLFEIIEGLPCQGIPVVDYEGQLYKTVQIGNQCWFKENLNIGTYLYGAANQTNNGIIERYCYNNFYPNCIAYGGLYQWDETMQYIYQPHAQGICPSGWHIPGDDEWCILTQYLDATVDCNEAGWSGTDIGGSMKETGFNHWISPNSGATNSSGFTALPAGNRELDGIFGYIGTSTTIWSSTESTSNTSWYRVLNTSSSQIWRFFYNKEFGFSVRCIKN
jgi:uncharacterized protein (TIGR02145 family)